MMEVKEYGSLNYIISYPDDFDEQKNYPLIIYIHGAGGRGNNPELLMSLGLVYEIKKGRKLPFVVAAPQCYADTWFEIFDKLLAFIEHMINSGYVDKTRVYLTGASMGGYTSWQVAMTRPEWFAALVPICGGGMYWNAGRLKDVPVWAFHGALDDVVYVTESINMVNAVNKAGGNAMLTVYPDVAHNSWERAFASDELYEWLMRQVKA